MTVLSKVLVSSHLIPLRLVQPEISLRRVFLPFFLVICPLLLFYFMYFFYFFILYRLLLSCSTLLDFIFFSLFFSSLTDFYLFLLFSPRLWLSWLYFFLLCSLFYFLNICLIAFSLSFSFSLFLFTLILFFFNQFLFFPLLLGLPLHSNLFLLFLQMIFFFFKYFFLFGILSINRSSTFDFFIFSPPTTLLSYFFLLLLSLLVFVTHLAFSVSAAILIHIVFILHFSARYLQFRASSSSLWFFSLPPPSRKCFLTLPFLSLFTWLLSSLLSHPFTSSFYFYNHFLFISLCFLHLS